MPAHLEKAVREMQACLPEGPIPPALQDEVDRFFSHSYALDAGEVRARDALRISAICNALSQPVRSVQALALYVAREALALARGGDWVESLNLLIEGVQLTHSAIPNADAYQAQVLVKYLAGLVAQAFRLCATADSLDDMIAVTNLEHMFEIAKSVWRPDLYASLDAGAALLFDISKAVGRSGDEVGDALVHVAADVAQARDSVRELRHRARGSMKDQADLMLDLLAAWYDLTQRQAVQQMRQSEAPRSEQRTLESRVEEQIGQVERDLRELIARKYAEQYGDRWIAHVQERQERMFVAWEQTLQKDRSAFQLYQEYAPSILDYAHLGDLLQLVAGDWAMFREVFDFGQGRRNKAVFEEKMQHIIKVRNPLAHHRTIPENELLRALVLCTDILMALGA
jgi:hypothetical protein